MMRSADGVSSDGAARGAASRRPRRATSAQTGSAPVAADASPTPEADWAEWLARTDAPQRSAGERRGTPAAGADERDQWFLDERPPHWG